MNEPTMNLRQALAAALKTVRKNRRLTQEDFGLVSSRTYLSTLERGLKSPTLDKLQDISEVMTVHPASLILLACAIRDGDKSGVTIDSISTEAKSLLADWEP
jgi:transcriptional regulator with XRE-family HTH domain